MTSSTCRASRSGVVADLMEKIATLTPLSPQCHTLIEVADAGGAPLVEYLHRLGAPDLDAMARNTAILHEIVGLCCAAGERSAEMEYLCEREVATHRGLLSILSLIQESEPITRLSAKSGLAVIPLVVPYLYSEQLTLAELVTEILSPEIAVELTQKE